MRRRTQLDLASDAVRITSDPAPSHPSQPLDATSTTVLDETIENHGSQKPKDIEPEDRLSLDESLASTVQRPQTPPAQDEAIRHRRFSLLRFRNASDSQLSVRAKQQAERPPPVPVRRM